MDIAAILGFVISNPLTSTPGAIGLLHGVGGVLTDLSAGKNIIDALSPHLNEIMLSFGLLAAKDANVTGGSRAQ